MKKYDENQLMKIGIILCTVFLCAIICSFSGFSINFKWFEKSKRHEYKSDYKDIVQQTIVEGNLDADVTNKIMIPLPKGIGESNTVIKKDIANKKVNISFPQMTTQYDTSKVVNNSTDVKNVHFSSSSSMINIELNLSQFKDCDSCFDNGILYLSFQNPSDQGKPVIVIDPGHGGNDVGAIQNGIYEKDIDLQVCMALKELLDNENVIVYFTRTDDSFPSVEQRVDFVNAIMPDLFISVHSNWYKNSSVSGTSVLYNKKDNATYSSKWLSNIINEEVVKSCNTQDKGTIIGNDIHIVRNSKVPVALLEVGFMSNSYDFGLISSTEGQEKVAQGINKGIIRALTEMGKY